MKKKRKERDEYLLKKYRIPQMGDYSQPGSILCDILERLDTNKRLNKSDKQWIRDKGMFNFYKFLENWENKGKPNFNDIRPLIQKSRNSRKKNSASTKRKKKSVVNLAVDMRKPHMPLQYKKSELLEHIKLNIRKITPKNIQEDISSLFLPEIWNSINEDIRKDINELFSAYSHSLWTATSLMAYRIFENVLKVHIIYDLKDESVKYISDAINILEKHKYDTYLLNTLRNLKDHRNNFMHGKIRASPQEAKKSIMDVMLLTMSIHNLR